MAERDLAFGRYRLQSGRGLLADGVTVPIGAKALQILETLVRAEGHTVTKDDLMDRVWPGVVIEVHNIHVHISALRKALGEDAGWIRTVSRFGYRFVGPATIVRPPSLPRAGRLNRLFGREDDVAAIEATLNQARLVTLVGPGGIGKTRLALEICHIMEDRYRDGALFVDLSMVDDPSLVASQVAAAMGVELRGEGRPAELLARRLKSRQALIVLDNCEHVLREAAVFTELILVEAPLVWLLATSREPVNCIGERVYVLPSLAVPGHDVSSAAEALDASSVALLVDRLQAGDSRFALTDTAATAACKICRRLDGLPLAIEMVGALAPVLGLEMLAVQLEEAFRLPHDITGTKPPRHRSLEATFDWSHDFLSLDERVMLRRLALFPGRFSLAAIEAIIPDQSISIPQCGDLLAGLVRKSLVSIDLATVPLSYRLLETVRAYAIQKLEFAGEQDRLRARHAHYVGDVLAHAAREWDATPDSIWLDRYGWLIADLRAALKWSFASGGNPALGSMMVGLSAQLWRMLNLNSEGRRWSEIASAELGPDVSDGTAAAKVWFAVGFLTGSRHFERSILTLQKAADLFGLQGNLVERGFALAVLGQMLALSGSASAATDALTESRVLLRQGPGLRRLGVCAMGFGLRDAAIGAWSAARQEYDLARTLFQAAGAKRLETAALCNLADMMWAEGILEPAIETAREALHLARRERHRRYIGIASGHLTGMLTAFGQIDAALVAAREAVPFCREDEYLEWLYPHLVLRVLKAAKPDHAARLWGYATRLPGAAVHWQINGQRAATTVSDMLADTLDPFRLEQLMVAGSGVSEDDAIALALDP